MAFESGFCFFFSEMHASIIAIHFWTNTQTTHTHSCCQLTLASNMPTGCLWLWTIDPAALREPQGPVGYVSWESGRGEKEREGGRWSSDGGYGKSVRDTQTRARVWRKTSQTLYQLSLDSVSCLLPSRLFLSTYPLTSANQELSPRPVQYCLSLSVEENTLRDPEHQDPPNEKKKT